MKSCPVCHSTYPRDFTLCPRDGTKLVEVGVWSEGTLVRGKYRIIGKIGEGGMAAVFKAMHVRFEELRALKVISADLSSDSSFIKRLQQEAVITRRLQHPNAVRVEDIDEAEDGRPFIVMEYIEGRSLKDVIEEAPLPVDRTCRIVKQVAAALDAAHALGILHRDIKPANIVLIATPEGEQAKVLDFGIAKVKEANLGETAEMTLTGKGRVVGTSAYMSPEQAMGMRGDELDGRSDLYSLGVVMYQMLVGELPLKAESEVTMLIAHIQATPKPIKLLRPELPDYIADLVMRLLEKKRELRPANGRALIEEIEAWERGDIGQPAPEAPLPAPEQTVLYREALKPGAESPPPAPPPPSAEPLPQGEATALASGFGAKPWGPPTQAPLPAAEEVYPASEATRLASGFGASQASPSSPPPPPLPVEAPESYASGTADGATTFASSFGTSEESSPPAAVPPAEEAYPPGEATRLASSLAGTPETDRGSSTASRLASGASVWQSASAVAAQQHGETPPAGGAPAWGQEAQAGQAVQAIEGQAVPARKSSTWLLWAAVPVVAIGLTAGAWYVLTHGGLGSMGGSPPSSTSPSPAATTPASSPPADTGSAQPAGGQPASGSAPPPTAGAPESGAAGAASKPEETKPAETQPAQSKPAESEAPAETKAVDRRAVQALKAEGDADYDKGLYDEAISAYRKALKLDPGSRQLTQQIARAKKAQQTEKNLLK